MKCACTHEAGDSDCATHPGCPNCGESLETTELWKQYRKAIELLQWLDHGGGLGMRVHQQIRQVVGCGHPYFREGDELCYSCGMTPKAKK